MLEWSGITYTIDKIRSKEDNTDKTGWERKCVEHICIR
jgi:hypothetical protein